MKQLELKGGIEVPVKSSSKKFDLNKRDLLLGLLMAALTPVAVQLYDTLMAWLSYDPITIDWRALAKTGIASGTVYVMKNFFDKGKIVIDSKEYEEAKK